MSHITLSVVTYCTDYQDLKEVILSVKRTTQNWRLFIVDNSPTNQLEKVQYEDKRITYIFNNANIGFGAAHNIAIDLAIKQGATKHFIVNPDISFTNDVITPMVQYMESHENIGMMMPQVVFPSGEIQFLPKLLPNPVWLLRRKLRWPMRSYNKFLDKYELRGIPPDRIYNSPILSGCFTLLNLKVIEELGGYDESFFMYFEDFDLSRRVHEHYKTLYFPLVSVVHGYESGANKSSKLFKIFVRSAIRYFNKWGWISDTKRLEMNKKALLQLPSKEVV